MGIIGDLSTLVAQAYKIWQDTRGKASVTPQELYDKYIAPSYQLLKLVHANYLETYLELEERIALEPSLSDATVRWFARARTKMQADRSELRLVDVPLTAGKSEAVKDVNSTATAYIVAVQEYFQPRRPSRSHSHQRVMGSLGRTPSSETEAQLGLMLHWMRLSPESQRALAAEEHLEHASDAADRSLDVLLIEVMRAIRGDLEAAVAQHLQALHDEGCEALAAIEAAGTGEQRRILLRIPAVGFRWQDVLNEHVREQRWAFEHSMSTVQKAYIRFRVLAERA